MYQELRPKSALNDQAKLQRDLDGLAEWEKDGEWISTPKNATSFQLPDSSNHIPSATN